MVTFSHLDAGTPEQSWRDAGVEALPALDPHALPGRGGLLVVVAAHPDDESLGAAGLVHRALRAGADVAVLLCTAGEASHPESPSTTPDQLAALRLAEFGRAMDTLSAAARSTAGTAATYNASAGNASAGNASTGNAAGPGTLTWRYLGLPDSGIAQRTADLDDALAELLAAGRHAVVVSTYRDDGHTDHEAVGRAAARAARKAGAGLLEFPIWYWHWSEPGHEEWRNWSAVRLDSAALDAKQRALAAHESQTGPLSPQPGDEALLSPGFLSYFDRGVEVFRWTPPPRGAGTAAKDFDSLYRRKADPWSYLSSWYEQRKRAVTMAALPRERYRHAFEAGCSLGLLTEELAARCGRVTAVDASEVALQRASERLAGSTQVELLRADLPDGWPGAARDLDLVVVSEIGYFLQAAELRGLLERAKRALVPGGHLVLCHWLNPIMGWELDGETVHAMARATTGWDVVVEHRERDFLLEVLQAPEQTNG
jgi:LmbE family N-acetylglucosaminyl deacetylase/SAM-dependent methyltransferase